MECGIAILKLLLMVFNFVFCIVNFIMTILFFWKVTLPVSDGDMPVSILAIQFSLLGLTILFIFGLWVTVKRKFVLLKCFSILLAIFIAAQVAAAALLLAGQGKDIFTDVVNNFCHLSHTSGTSKADEKVGDFLWVCCCPATCDIPGTKGGKFPTPAGITAGDMITCDYRNKKRATGGCAPSTHGNHGNHTGPHRLQATSGSWAPGGDGTLTDDYEQWYQEYRDWKWPLLACPANQKTDTAIAMENHRRTDLSSGPSKIAGMPKLTAWMAGDHDAKSGMISRDANNHGISAAKWTNAAPAAKAGSTCKTQTQCLDMYIHEKENTMEIFAGVLLAILFFEMLMTIATWHLGKRVNDNSGIDSSYVGGSDLTEGASAKDALDGYMLATR